MIMLKMQQLGILVFLSLCGCVAAVVFPYNPRRPVQPKVNTALKESHCPKYYTYYDGDTLNVVLQRGQCEMIIDKFSMVDSISIEGQPVANQDSKMNYIPILKFRNLSPICPNLPYEYRGTRVVVQTSYNCQLSIAVKSFSVMSPKYAQPIQIARPVIENMNTMH